MLTSPSAAMPSVSSNTPLQGLNTLAIPASADYFAKVGSVEALKAALVWWQAEGAGLPVMALGGGSNLVLAGNVPGLVLQIEISGREIVREDERHLWLKVGAGENWHDLVQNCMSFHYWGLENLALIPGSVGAAPIQNIGAYGVELCDCFAELTAIEISTGKSVTFDREACEFGYRDSVFKGRLRDQYIITSVTFKLGKQASVHYEYPALKEHFASQGIASPTPGQVFDAVVAVRRSKLPDPLEIPNAGSFFKNPVVSQEQYEQLKLQHEGLVGYPVKASQQSADDPYRSHPQVKLAAGWLIDRAGWRGYQQGAVGVHRLQALVLVNPGCGDGAEVLALARAIQMDIQSKYGVELEIEPRVYGADGGC